MQSSSSIFVRRYPQSYSVLFQLHSSLWYVRKAGIWGFVLQIIFNISHVSKKRMNHICNKSQIVINLAYYLSWKTLENNPAFLKIINCMWLKGWLRALGERSKFDTLVASIMTIITIFARENSCTDPLGSPVRQILRIMISGQFTTKNSFQSTWIPRHRLLFWKK